MKKYLVKFYNSWPLRLFSETTVTVYLHPALWKFGKSPYKLDVGPVEVMWSGKYKLVWLLDEETQSIMRGLTPEDEAKAVANLKKLIDEMVKKSPGSPNGELH